MSPQERATDDRSAAERHVRQVYAQLRTEGGRNDVFDWIGLAALREKLSARGMNRGEQDRALWALMRQDGVNLVPESNQKTLTQADRDAAIHIGGQDKHLISIFSGDWRAALNDTPPPLPSQVATQRQAQREADRAALQARLEAMTLPKLRDVARRLGLSPSGRKADLIGNLMFYEGRDDLAAAL